MTINYNWRKMSLIYCKTGSEWIPYKAVGKFLLIPMWGNNDGGLWEKNITTWPRTQLPTASSLSTTAWKTSQQWEMGTKI